MGLYESAHPDVPGMKGLHLFHFVLSNCSQRVRLGLEEKGLDGTDGRVLVEVDPRYFRPSDVALLLGDSAKAERVLGWRHTTAFEALVAEMVESDRAAIARERGAGRGERQ